MPERQGSKLWKHLGGQGALLFSGFALAQGMSFARNAVLGHWLSRGDFGIAATLTLMLQLVEMVSDIGVDRMIVQARDGDDPRLIANAHTTLILRGALTSLALFLIAGPVTSFFRVENALFAFQMIALVPFVKGFVHLDSRRFQRRLLNGPQMFVEVAPQAVALALVVPVLSLVPGYNAIIWLSLGQGVFALAVSHYVSERPYRVALDYGFLVRLFHFGWPIWLSAFPLIAVFQGDRIIVGRALGMESLAGFSAAFMMTMVPSLVGAKIGQSLMLPLLAEKREAPGEFLVRFMTMADLTVVITSMYLFSLVCVGGIILPVAFGPNYYGLSMVVAMLAVMWSVRMVQVVPGMALMAFGDTRPLLVAGMVRGMGVLAAIGAVVWGFGLIGVVCAGVAAEVASLLYTNARTSRDVAGAGKILSLRSAFLVPVGIAGFVVAYALPNDVSFALAMCVGFAGTVAVGVGAALALPSLRSVLVLAHRRLFNSGGDGAVEPMSGV